jgi:long-chain acyl-CoA synthetase
MTTATTMKTMISTPEIVTAVKNHVEFGCKDAAWKMGQFIPRFDVAGKGETMADAVEQLVREDPALPLFGRRRARTDSSGSGTAFEDDFTWLSRGDAFVAMNKVAEFLRGVAGLPRGATVGIFSAGRPEFAVTQYGCYRRALVPVPLYATLGPGAIAFVIEHAELAVVFASGQTLPALVDSIAGIADGKCPTRLIVSYDRVEVAEDMAAKLARCNMRLVFWEELLATTPELAPEYTDKPKPEDLFVILYTSGTTGRPKGVMISHRSCCYGVDCTLAAPEWEGISPARRAYLSFLPLAHTFEQEFAAMAIRAGMRVRRQPSSSFSSLFFWVLTLFSLTDRVPLWANHATL